MFIYYGLPIFSWVIFILWSPYGPQFHGSHTVYHGNTTHIKYLYDKCCWLRLISFVDTMKQIASPLDREKSAIRYWPILLLLDKFKKYCTSASLQFWYMKLTVRTYCNILYFIYLLAGTDWGWQNLTDSISVLLIFLKLNSIWKLDLLSG